MNKPQTQRMIKLAITVISIAVLYIALGFMPTHAAWQSCTDVASCAAGMPAGSWVEVPQNSTIDLIKCTFAATNCSGSGGTGGSGNRLPYSNSGGWDPVRHKLTYVGEDHGPCFVGAPHSVNCTGGSDEALGWIQGIHFDATTNNWSLDCGYQVTTPVNCGWRHNPGGHGYEHTAVDPSTGIAYYKEYPDAANQFTAYFDKILPANFGTPSWVAATDQYPLNNGLDVVLWWEGTIGGATPGTRSGGYLLHYACQDGLNPTGLGPPPTGDSTQGGGLDWWNPDTDTWFNHIQPLGSDNGYNGFSAFECVGAYNKTGNYAMVGGGIIQSGGVPAVQNKLWRVNADTTVHALPDPPVHVTVQGYNLVEDPAGTDMLAMGAGNLYSIDINGTFTLLGGSNVPPSNMGDPTGGGVSSNASSVISAVAREYGVVLYVSCRVNPVVYPCNVFLYKPINASSPFDTKCAAVGVIACYGFDSASATRTKPTSGDPLKYFEVASNAGFSPDPCASGTTGLTYYSFSVNRGPTEANTAVVAQNVSSPTCYYPTIDSTVSHTGAGSLKAGIPTNSDAQGAGYFTAPFAGLDNSSHVAVYPGGSLGGEMWYQWYQRFSPEMLNQAFSSNPTYQVGWKQNIIVGPLGFTGDSPYGLVNINTYLRGVPQYYFRLPEGSNIGVPNGEVQNKAGLGTTWPTGCSYGFQTGASSLWASNPASGLPAGQGYTAPPCIQYAADTWMEFTNHIKFGGCYTPDSQIDLYVNGVLVESDATLQLAYCPGLTFGGSGTGSVTWVSRDTSGVFPTGHIYGGGMKVAAVANGSFGSLDASRTDCSNPGTTPCEYIYYDTVSTSVKKTTSYVTGNATTGNIPMVWLTTDGSANITSIIPLAGSTVLGPGYGQFYLDPQMTNMDPAAVHPDAFTWFDDVIISNQPITMRAIGDSYYTATTGDDSNTCLQAQSVSTPKLTIAGGLSCLASGDTLIIEDGTYAEGIEKDAIPSGIYATSPTIVKAANRGMVTLTALNADSAIIMVEHKDFITIDGINADASGTATATPGVVVLGGDGSTPSNGSTYLTYQYGTIIGNIGSGCLGSHGYPSGNSHNITVSHATIHDCGYMSGSTTIHGLYVNWADSLIEYSTVYNTDGSCILIFSSDSTYDASNDTVNANLAHDCGNVPFRSGSGTGQVWSNNRAYSGGGVIGGSAGIWVDNTNGGTEYIYNNTVYSNTGKCIHSNEAAGTIIAKNNICWLNSSNLIDGNGGTVTQDHNICGSGCASSNNPSFINAPSNFHLNAGSPAIGAGSDLSATFTTDADAITRSVPWDLGAFTIAPCATPTHLAFTSQPSNAVIGASVGIITVAVKDASEATCSGDTSTITLSKHSGDCTGMTLNGTVSGANVFTTTSLNMTVATGSCSLDATDGALTGATSSSFTISAAPVTPHAGHIRFRK